MVSKHLRTPGTGEAGHTTPWLLGVLCLLIPIIPGSSAVPGPLKSVGWPPFLMAFVLVLLVALDFLVRRRHTGAVTLRPSVIIAATYVFLQLLVYGVGVVNPGSALMRSSETRALLGILMDFGLLVYTTTRLTTSRQRTFVIGALVVGLTINCLVGILPELAGIDVDSLRLLPGLVENQQAVNPNLPAGETNRFGVVRSAGLTLHPIEFAVLSSAAVPLTLHFVRFGGRQWIRVSAALAAVLALFAMPTGVSRSGVIALAVALSFYAWSFTLRQVIAGVGAGAIALLAGLVFFPTPLEAVWSTILNSSEDESVLARVARYAKVSADFYDHPIFGRGLGSTATAEYGPLDNQWLQAVVQGGLVGLCALLILVLGGVFGIAAALRSATNRSERALSYAVGAAFLAILSSSFAFDLFGFPQARLFFLFCIGWLWSGFGVRVLPPPVVAAVDDRVPVAG